MDKLDKLIITFCKNCKKPISKWKRSFFGRTEEVFKDGVFQIGNESFCSIKCYEKFRNPDVKRTGGENA